MDEKEKIKHASEAIIGAVAGAVCQINEIQKNAETYVKDGLLFCSKCNTEKQVAVKFFGMEKIMPCLCECELREQERIELEAKKEKFLNENERNRLNGIPDKALRSFRFEYDNRSDIGFTDFLRDYAGNYEEIKKNNIGLFIYGEKGSGKTFGAACLANKLIDSGQIVMMSTFPRLERMIFDSDDKNRTIAEIVSCDFLIIDDFGVERDTSYQKEMLYTIIDERYKSEKPLILTSNISFKELSQMNSRISDRLLDMCQPLKKEGKSKRLEKAVNKAKLLKEVMGR